MDKSGRYFSALDFNGGLQQEILMQELKGSRFYQLPLRFETQNTKRVL